MTDIQTANQFCADYLASVSNLMQRILSEEAESMKLAACRVADQISRDKLVYVFGPGGHSNLAAQELFFRAGGLMHISAILDEGTLLSNGALRSMAVERTPGYGKIVIQHQDLQAGDLLLLVNAYGINAALIDAALEARARGVYLIGISSHEHAENTATDHPARHPSSKNLHDLVDISIDSKVAVGDALVRIEGISENIAAASTFTNAYALNCLVIQTVLNLRERGIEPPIWRSGNAPGGDAANQRFIEKFRHRVRAL